MVDPRQPVTPDVDDAYLRELLTGKRSLDTVQISEMLADIKPVVRQGDRLHYIEPVDPRSVAFTWSPKFLEEASVLTELSSIHTLHTYGYYGMFKPSLEEVLSMIPEDMISKVNAFETHGPKDVGDLRRQWSAVDAGYHVATTILFA